MTAAICRLPDGRTAAADLRAWPGDPVEESPGSTGKRCRLTAGGGDPRESATENTPPAQEPSGVPRARAKRCGKSAPRPWQQGRQGKPHREQDRIGAVVPQGTGVFPLRRPGWSREARREARPRGMVVPHSGETRRADRTRLTGRLAVASRYADFVPHLIHTERKKNHGSVTSPASVRSLPLNRPYGLSS